MFLSNVHQHLPTKFGIYSVLIIITFLYWNTNLETLNTCSPKIPPHIKNDGLGSFRRIWSNS